MANPKIAVFFPSKQGEVKAYLSNVKLRLDPPPTGNDFAAKYSLDATKVARIGTLFTEIPAHLDLAEQLRNQAQSETENAQKKIREANLNHEFGDAMQKNSAFDIADFELIGYNVDHTAADPNTAKVQITHISYLSDRIRFDWAKEGWNGIKIYASNDATNYVLLDKDDRSPFDDTRKNQKVNTPETRFYIFRHVDKDGNEIGQETKIEIVAAIYDITGGRGLAN